MLKRTAAVLIAVGGLSLLATQSHAESALSIAERYIDKLKSNHKLADLDLDKLRSERRIGRFDLSKIRSETKIGGYDLNSLSSSGFWKKSETSEKTSGMPSALPLKAKKISGLSSKASRYASKVNH
jgi:hypothetical protein